MRLSPPSGYYLGSGSIVSSDGLILTNAHVAAPTAPGLAGYYGPELFREADPEQLVVSTTTGDGAAEPTYVADILVVDGHLDLAVAKVSSYADGSPLPDNLDLPFVPLGSVADLTRGDDLTVYGYPALNQGDRLTVRPGVVGAFLPDPSGRVPGDRYIIETDATFSGGNSGGMALSNAGELVGVPSSTFTSGLATAHELRAVDLATPLLEAARSGGDYRTPYLTPATGDESIEDLGWGPPKKCSAPGPDVPDDSKPDGARVRLEGFAPGEDVLLVLSSDEGVRRVLASTHDPEVDCVSVPLPTDDQGDLLPAAYRLAVFAGPDRALVGQSSVVVEESFGD